MASPYPVGTAKTSMNATWLTDDVERTLILEPGYRGHMPILVGPDWHAK